MNILIVDDNKHNRMILRLLIEGYMENHSEMKFSLDEAEDGMIAVNKCKDNHYEIIFMDIMMPNMDGLEATRIIRETDKNTMIIAVSAIDDLDRIKIILNNGAEDYISKPLNADVFTSRISNYIKLALSRNREISSTKCINLFSSNIYSRHTKFIINSEDSLAEFWEFFLLNARSKYDNLSDLIRVIFSIADALMHLSLNSAVYIEETDDEQYFTLTNIDKLPSDILEHILQKDDVNIDYKTDDSKISFILKKIITESKEESEKAFEKPEKHDEKQEDIASPAKFSLSKELSVFDYIESEDLYDLEEYAGKLNSIMLVVGTGGVTEEEVVEIYTNLEKIASILATYSEVYPISKALLTLSADMSSHVQEFMDNSEALGPMCKAFSNDMSKWIEQSFHTGAPSADFMNDTIVVNSQTIGGMLKMDEVPADGGDDLDDIFDF